MSCETCRFYAAPNCARYPTHLKIVLPHTCGEHQLPLPSEDILKTSISDLQLTFYTKTLCRRLGLKTVQDIVDFGRSFVKTGGSPDRHAITELAASLQKIGVVW